MSLSFATRLASLASEYGIEASERSTFNILLVARVLAFRASLPTSPVENVVQFYADSVEQVILNQVSEINEVTVVPVQPLLEFVKKVWMARYRAVFVPTSEEAGALITEILNGSESLNGTDLQAFIGRLTVKRSLMHAVRDLNETLG